jgi:P27 family predicted phage terminase small subunit
LSLLRIQGTLRPVRHADIAEPEAAGDLATKPPPEWMTASQREFWTETLLDAPKDVLRRIDWAMFAGYVETWDRYVRLIQAQQRLDAATEVPFLIKGASGPHISPYLRQMDRCLLLLARYGGEMGFTPAGRARLAVARLEDEDAAANDWAALRQLRLVHDRDKE